MFYVKDMNKGVNLIYLGTSHETTERRYSLSPSKIHQNQVRFGIEILISVNGFRYQEKEPVKLHTTYTFRNCW